MRKLPNDTKKSGQQGYQNDDTFADVGDASMLTDLEDSDSEEETHGRGQQGFASMSKEKQREIASKGGKAAHEQGTAHEWDSEEAAAAGRRGGQKRAA